MGVDYYNCDVCGEIYDDCGCFYSTCESCGKRICFSCQVDLDMRTKDNYFSKGAEPEGNYWQDDSWEDDRGVHKHYALIQCPYCLNEIVDDDDLLKFLLKKVGLTKNQAIEEYKKSK